MQTRFDIVLVVDDSPETVRLLTDVLDGEGMKVTVALDGATALRIASRIRPDIVLMDAVMPEMDGFECCRRLKDLSGFDNVPVIFMTGLGEPGDAVRGFGAGGADYVTKPIDIDAMLARIHVHLTNARKIASARLALDATDQYLAAANADGEIAWFTPKAYRLLQERLEGTPHSLRLPQTVMSWLREIPPDTRPGSNCGRSLSTVEFGLRISYVGRSDGGERLLRIADASPADQLSAIGVRFSLTPRETEVLSWIVKGKSTRDVATILSMSPRTVDKHLQTIFAKMGVENRTAAAALILSGR